MSGLEAEFIQIGKIEEFLESITIASACNKVHRKRFLKPDTNGLIPSGGYSGNVNYSNRDLMWLVYMEQTHDCTILHACNGPRTDCLNFPHLIMDGFCAETGNVYEFFGFYFYGHTCLAFCDVTALRKGALAER